MNDIDSGLASVVGTIKRDAVSGKDGVEALGKFWHDYMTVFDELNKVIPYRATVSRHVDYLQPKPGELVLDAGSGTGNLTELLAATGATVEGIDFCEVSLRLAAKKVPAARFRFGDLREPLPYGPERFDKIGSCLALHLLDRQSQRWVLREFFRVLKPGGVIAISGFMDFFRPWGPVKAYFGTLRAWWKAMNPVGGTLYALKNTKGTIQIVHYILQIMAREKRGLYQFFNRDVLTQLFTEAGFEIQACEPVFSGQCVIASARKPSVARR